MDRHALRVLHPIIVCSRAVLADMEFDDIPVHLRNVARSSARTLPPPFAQSVIKELKSNESFRTAVLEQYQDDKHADGDLVAFLEDPGDGEPKIEALAEAARGVGQSADLASARGRISEVEDQLAKSKTRLSSLRDQHDEDLIEARSSAAEGQRRAEARVQALTRAVGERGEVEQELTAQVQVLTEELAAMKMRLDGAIDRLRKRDAAPPLVSQVRVEPAISDPLELARWLDDVEHRVRPFREARSGGGDQLASEPFLIGPGVSPESGAAMDALIRQGARRFILDGYNIGGEIDASSFSTRAARDDVVRRAGVLARATEAEIVVVFDGPDDDGRKGFRSADGVSVRFSTGDKADDVIAELVAADSDRVVVITNDRDLRGRCAVDGCVQIWSTAFLDWP